jgi:hypothetical protein
MRIAMMAAMATLAATTGVAPAQARALPPAHGRQVMVCLAYDAGFETTALAEGVATRIYNKIGVKIEWRSIHCPTDSIQIKLQFRTPTTMQPGALAYAMPYEGTHIVVFFDRIAGNTDTDSAVASLFGHVLAHEICHVLEGIARHSDSGLMKAHWSPEDIRRMRVQPMAFSEDDLDLIYRGLARRSDAVIAAGL